MKIILPLLFFVMTGAFCFAQRFDIKYGPENEINKESPGVASIVGADDDGFYTVKFIGGHGYLGKIDKSGKSMYVHEIVVPAFDYETSQLLSVVYFKDHFEIFTSNFDKDKKVDYLFANYMDVNGNVGTEHHLIDEKTVQKTWTAGNFSYLFSNDTSKILVYHREDYESKENIRLTLSVYDFNFKNVWKSTVTLPYTNKEINLQGFDVSTDGTGYLLAQKGGQHENKEPENNYLLFKFENGELKKPITIALGEGKFIRDTRFRIDDENNIVFAGFYAKSLKNGIIGTFYVRVNGQTDEIEVNAAAEFSPNFLATIFKVRDVQKEKGLEGFYHMNEFRVEKDESLFILAQNSYTATDRYGANKFYNNIIATHIYPDGKIQWQVSVPMQQISGSRSEDFLGYLVFKKNDSYVLVYNDNPDNIYTYYQANMKAYHTSEGANKGDVVAATITTNGKLKKTKLFSNEVANTYSPFVDRGGQVADDEVLLLLQRPSSYRFARVTME